MAIRTGEKLLYQGAVVRVVKLESLEQIKIQDQAKQFHTVSRKELSAIPEETEIPDSDEIFALSDKEFADAAKLHDTILPILNAPGDGSVVGRVSKESKIPAIPGRVNVAPIEANTPKMMNKLANKAISEIKPADE